MKRYVAFALVAVLCTFVPHSKCKAMTISKDDHAVSRIMEQQRPVLPILIRLGEQYFIRLDDPKQSLRAADPSSPPRATTINHALQLQLTQRLLQEEVDEIGNVLTDKSIQPDSANRNRRGDEPPISLDLTFHLLREVLEMARAEQLAQQANNNRKIMDFFGK